MERERLKKRGLRVMAWWAVLCCVAGGWVAAFEIRGIIDPSHTHPVEVVIWVKDGVTAEDEARVLAQIQQGLQMLEDIPTSSIAFDIVSVIRSTNDPGALSHQLRIISGNVADLTSGGASGPAAGNPGTWWGAVADSPELDLVPTTAHEVGHAIGFRHSTLSVAYPSGQRPIMHWKIGSPVVLADDIAAASVAYPTSSAPLTTATLRGRLVVAGGSMPVSGVNVVSVDTSSGVPAVARLSGVDDEPGSFELPYLPPGTYEVHFLDGESYRGCCLGHAGGRQMDGGFQADNFADFAAAAVTVSAGEDLDLGDIEVALLPLSLEGIHTGPIGSFDSSITLKPLGPGPKDASLGQPYEVWFQIRGGLRDLTASVSGLPEGLNGGYAPDPRVPNVGVHGRQFVRLVGTPLVTGDFTITMDVQDALGQSTQFLVDLGVGIACGDDIDEDSIGDCTDTCLDLDADGYGLAGGGGNGCLGRDCVEGDPDTYPDAPEVNDALDNQCPGDEGFGLVDEISGGSVFEFVAGVDQFNWPDQSGATSYEVARSQTADFSSGCVTFHLATGFLQNADVPALGQAFHYLAHPGAPNVGSWGASTAGERLIVCPGTGPDLFIRSLTHEPQNPVVGQTITFTAVVENIGSGAAGPSTLSLRIGGESPNDPVTQFSVPVLQPGQSELFQRQTVLFSAGTFLNTAAADLFDDVLEVVETNNQQQIAVTVLP